MLSVDLYYRLTGETPDFKAYLAAAPALDLLELDRDDRPARVVAL